MKKKKALFFDIDGTIWNEQNEIPLSTLRAIREVRERGHLAFINTGRCKSFIHHRELKEIGFDGVVCGCGTMIEYAGETIFYKKLETELVEHTLRTVRSFGFHPILEGREYLYLDDEEFGTDPYGMKLKREMGDKLLSIAGEWGRWEVSKLACATEGADQEACFAALAEYYDYKVHNAAVVEMVPKGFDKGKGISKVCELLNMDLSDTIAFGDSVNDLEMLQAAGVGVAMGNGSDAAKRAADYVTSAMEEDGIWNACRHLGLLE